MDTSIILVYLQVNELTVTNIKDPFKDDIADNQGNFINIALMF